MELRDEVTKEMDAQLFSYQYYLDHPFELDFVLDTVESINNNQILKEFYNDRDTKTLVDLYVNGVNELKEKLKSISEDENDYYLCLLEYTRFMCMSDNYPDYPGIKYFETLNDSPVSSLLIGKGNMSSQAKLIRDLSLDRVNSYVSLMNLCKHPRYYTITDKHPVCYMFKGNNKLVIDPTSYFGYQFNSGLIEYSLSGRSDQLDFSKDKIMEARKKVSKMLIKDLNIDLLSNDLVDQDDSLEDKVKLFVNYISENKNEEKVDVLFDSINYRDRVMDCGKLLELLLIHNNIPYTYTCTKSKNDAVYDINGMIIDSRNGFKIQKNKVKIKED